MCTLHLKKFYYGSSQVENHEYILQTKTLKQGASDKLKAIPLDGSKSKPSDFYSPQKAD